MSGVDIKAMGICKEYKKGDKIVSVLRDLDLDLAAGERVAILGDSGSGKSTLLQVLGTLDRPTTGRVLFGGEDLFDRSASKLDALRNRSIGFVFQFHHLLPDHSALRNVMIPLIIAGKLIEDAEDLAVPLLERVGLKDRMHHRPGELSGGEQQRVALARALIQRPQLILADEPTGNLDPVMAGSVMDLLFELNEDLGSTLVMVTHSMTLASRFQRKLVLRSGRLSLL